MGRTVIQSGIFKNKGTKLNYSVQVIFRLSVTQGFNKPDGPELKFMVYDVYPLPPSLEPCEYITSIYSPYINQAHVPLVNSMK